MPSCPRCGAPAVGASCAACGESLVFAPPSALADALPAQATLASGEGGGWLIASGVIQILLGAFWIIAGIALAALSQTSEFYARANIEKSPAIAAVILMVCAGGGLATIVISSFVISRRRWAWIVSLVFDGLWALIGVLALIFNPLSGVIYLAISISLILFLVAGRAALR